MCQEWIDGGRLVCLPSSSLLHAIIAMLSLTSPMTDRLLEAFPVLIGFPLPHSHSFPHFDFWRSSAMCVHHPDGSASEVKGVRNMSQRVVVGLFSFFPSELIWGWDCEELWATQVRFSILLCSSSFYCLGLDNMLSSEVISDRYHHVPFGA